MQKVILDPAEEDILGHCFLKIGSFCRHRKVLRFWSYGISLLELLCFLSFVSFVFRNFCSGTCRSCQDIAGRKIQAPCRLININNCYEPRRPIRPALISGFCSMKRSGVFLLPPGLDDSPSQGYPQH